MIKEREKLQKNIKYGGEESNELLRLMVDGIKRGWRDNNNGLLSKNTVEKKILPILNAKFGSQVTFTQYQSRLKWFKTRYNNYIEFIRNNSGFGWDPVTKKFTASDEVWENYLKAHPTHKSYRTDVFTDYEDLQIVVGNGAVGRYSIGLGDETDARTFGVDENISSGLDDLTYDSSTGAFIENNDNQDFLHRPEGKSSSLETNSSQSDVVDKLSHTIDKLTDTINSFATGDSCWDAIKEIPNLDNRTRFKALKILNTRAKKIEFLKMALKNEPIGYF
ncbi:hypothetical protein FNV43_RR21595 [Rhamnella rubrinervis]|uniref:Myb/SANT-like domain-containing protein n=1 Tax=Rhamnella rubrinervis TaxID=2594499 RepID=A0A8K0DNW5_9ROSA|nr:hypothetical protein FNV43_RR21595 [Rhamnella rubrinervis]